MQFCIKLAGKWDDEHVHWKEKIGEELDWQNVI